MSPVPEGAHPKKQQQCWHHASKLMGTGRDPMCCIAGTDVPQCGVDAGVANPAMWLLDSLRGCSMFQTYKSYIGITPRLFTRQTRDYVLVHVKTRWSSSQALFQALRIYHMGSSWCLQSQTFLEVLPILCAINLSPCHELPQGWVLPNTSHPLLTTPIRAHPNGLWSVSVGWLPHLSWLCEIYRFHGHSRGWASKWWYSMLSQWELISKASCTLISTRMNITGFVMCPYRFITGK